MNIPSRKREYIKADGQVWRLIPGFDGYAASDHGRIASTWRPTRGGAMKSGRYHYLKANADKAGYLKVTPIVAGKKITIRVHQLVALAFLGTCPDGHEVCHNNGNKADNSVSNLRYDTPANNHQDKVKHGTSTRGETHNTARLKESDVRTIRARLANGERVTVIANDYGICRASVHGISTGKSWGWLK